MRYQKKRIYNWSDSIAYTVGLMASDGCLISDGRHLDLTSTDLEQLNNFLEALGRKIKISEKQNASATTAYRVQFSDVAYYDFLLGVGLTPAKSKTIGRLNIPDQYYSHFLRGLFDGDGSTYSYNDPRWPTSFLYYVCFSSASRLFLEYISVTNQRLIKVKGSSIRKTAGAYSLVYGKADGYKIYMAMYRDLISPCLSRKKSKLSSFINTDRNASI